MLLSRVHAGLLRLLRRQLRLCLGQLLLGMLLVHEVRLRRRIGLALWGWIVLDVLRCWRLLLLGLHPQCMRQA